MQSPEEGRLPTVSVALCTYNGAQFVRDQIESILAQRYPDLEIVVSDDGSTDDTVDIVQRTFDSFHPTDAGAPSLRILRNEAPLGVVGNFQKAVLACSGDVVALSDQDDVWLPGRLKILVTRLEAIDHAFLVHSNARMVDDSGRPLGYTLFDAIGFTARERDQVHAGEGFRTLLRRNVVTGATSAFRRELIPRSFPVPDGWLHDEWLAIVAGATERFDFVDLESIDYRQHGSNEIGQLKPTWRYRIDRLMQPRAARNLRLLRRAQSLVERLEAMESIVRSEYMQLAREKYAHERMRSSLPPTKARRLPAIYRALRAGDYERFGRGLPDVVRDLIQPVA